MNISVTHIAVRYTNHLRARLADALVRLAGRVYPDVEVAPLAAEVYELGKAQGWREALGEQSS
jgi:hypothetical protein